MTYAYLREAGVREIIVEEGKRVSPEFLRILDKHIEGVVRRSCHVHNGGHKTLDAAIICNVLGM